MKTIFLVFTLIAVFVLFSGCTISPPISTSPNTQTTVIPTQTHTTCPIGYVLSQDVNGNTYCALPTTIPTTIGTPVLTTASSRPEITQVQEVLETPSSPTPVQTEIQGKKPADPFVSMQAPKTAITDIPNCTMGELVPAVKEPGYGLNSVKQLKLYFMSPGDYNKVFREYTENTNAFSMCYGVSVDPYWDILLLNSLITARNANPTTYNITLVVKSMGVDGPEYHTTLTMNPGQQYPLSVYIPIRKDQISLFSYDFKFEQIS